MTLKQRLQAALPTAMKARDSAAATALRSALAAIENAAAVPAPPALPFGQPTVGLGATEVPRRHQDETEIARIVAAEIAERRAAATEYDRLGQTSAATTKRAEADALATQ